MGPFDQSYIKADNLAAWLYFATDGLCASAKERIRGEIEAHYAEAVAGHLAEGQSEIEARVTALTELGDAKAAARRFRKRHLTHWEEKQIRSIEKEAAEPLFSFRTLLFSILELAGTPILFSYTYGIGYPWFFAACVLLIFAGLTLVPRLLVSRMPSKASRLKGFILSHLLACVGYGIALGQSDYSRSHDFIAAIPAPCILAGSLSFSWLKILAKLQNTGDFADEMPPKATAAS